MKVVERTASDIQQVDIHNADLARATLAQVEAGLEKRATPKPRREAGYKFRCPETEDGAEIWALVKATGVLDLNSAYSYVMLGEYFAQTCVVAERKGKLAGFVSGFIPPERPDTVFVWQVAVASSERGRGLAKTLLAKLLESEACEEVRYIEATVTPSNKASTRLFRAMARELGTSCIIEEGFAGDLFPGDNHEPERRFRVGPFTPAAEA